MATAEATKSTADSGLGLSQFLTGKEGPKDTTAPSPEAETKVETKTESEPVKTDDKKTSEETKSEIKTEEKTNVELELSKKEKAKKEEIKLPDGAPAFTDDDTYKKRYQDTGKWANQVHQQNLDLKKQIEANQHQLSVINKKLDGTYDPEKDEKPATQTISPEKEGEVRGRVQASEKAANELYGDENVAAALAKFNEVYTQNGAIQYRVLTSETPVMEVMKVMKEHAFYEKYGTNPEKVVEAIKKEYETELTTRITKEVTEKLMQRVDKKDGTPDGLSNVKGDNTRVVSDKKPTVTPLKDILGNAQGLSR